MNREFYGLGLFFSIPSVVMANKAKQITNQIPGHPDSGMATFQFFFRPKYEVSSPIDCCYLLARSLGRRRT